MLREKWRRKSQKGALEDKQSPLTSFLKVLARDSGETQLGNRPNRAATVREMTKGGGQEGADSDEPKPESSWTQLKPGNTNEYGMKYKAGRKLCRRPKAWKREKAQRGLASCHWYLSPSNQMLLVPERENGRSLLFKA